MAILRRPEGIKKRRKILGRGNASGQGGTSGRGHKGQNARSGGGVRPGFEGGQMPLYRRIARRGFSNYPHKKEYFVLNIKDLAAKFVDGETVNRQTLIEKGCIGKNVTLLKLLSMGDINIRLNIEFDKVSKEAKKKIEQAGGNVVQLQEVAVAEETKNATVDK